MPGPRTLFEGVTQARAGGGAGLGGRQVVDERPTGPVGRGAPAPGAAWEEDQEQLLELLRESVRARMISDVPLGVMLSGGLDSSLITALMAEQSRPAR